MQLKDEEIIAAYRSGEATGQHKPDHPKPHWLIPDSVVHPCLRHLWLCGYEEGKRMYKLQARGRV